MKNLRLTFCAGLLAAAGSLHAQVYFQGFEDSGWTVDTGNDWYEYNTTLTRTPSGAIPASSGSYYALVGAGNVHGAPYTYLGGSSTTWPGGFTTSLDVYIDLSDSKISDSVEVYGFDLTSAVNHSDGSFLRDFIFHVGDIDGTVYVGADNNSYGSVNTFVIGNDPNKAAITSSGWYTFQTEFKDVGGVLSVDLSVLDDLDNTIFSKTRSDPGDLISTVGANEYMWMVLANSANGLAIDNSMLTVVPEPGTYAALLGLATLGLVGFRRWKQRRIV